MHPTPFAQLSICQHKQVYASSSELVGNFCYNRRFLDSARSGLVPLQIKEYGCGLVNRARVRATCRHRHMHMHLPPFLQVGTEQYLVFLAEEISSCISECSLPSTANTASALDFPALEIPFFSTLANTNIQFLLSAIYVRKALNLAREYKAAQPFASPLSTPSSIRRTNASTPPASFTAQKGKVTSRVFEFCFDFSDRDGG